MKLSKIKWRVKSAAQYGEFLVESAYTLLTKDMWLGRPRTISCVQGASADSSRVLCIFASHDDDSRVRPSVFAYVEALAAAGLDIVFVSTSPSLESADLQRLRRSCIRVISRENRGYDFYSWKTGMCEYQNYMRHAGLLLANDSVCGPLFGISGLIQKLESNPADVVGMTDSLRHRYHLQSYFLYFKRRVVVSRRFVDFFRRVQPKSYKGSIIRRYEVGISHTLGREFSLSALYVQAWILSRISYGARPPDWTNLTIHLWKEMIVDFQFPFLKKSLLRSGLVSEAEAVRTLSAAGSTYDPSLLHS